MKLSIVIPAFDEQDRIGSFLTSIAAWSGLDGGVEVVVVDDGSTDGTVAVVEAFRDRIPALRIVPLGVNRGKGAAVRAGLREANGSWRIFLDADGSTGVDEIPAFVDAAAGDRKRIIIGSVAAAGADVEQTQSGLRQKAGRLGNRLVQAAALPGIDDSQRGCKLLSAEACEDVLPHCTVVGWGFDVELLAVGRVLGYEIVEIPIRWVHVDGSKVGGLAYFGVLLDVIRARRSARRVRRIESTRAGAR